MDPLVSENNHIDKLTKIGIALSAETDLEDFFNLVLEEAIAYSHADAGSIYTVSKDKRFLDFQIICTISKKVQLGPADVSKWPSVQLYDQQGEKRLKNFVSYVYHSKETLCLDDAYDQDIFNNSGTKEYDKNNNYRSKSMLAIPMMNHEKEVLGVIQLINSIDNNFDIVPFTESHIKMLTSLASQAGIALSNKKLIEGLENLLLQFIQTIAGAIDRKSKYTGGHISRVAKLTEQLGSKINEDKTYFPDKKFSEDELQELSLSGWMHDIGKITTPVYIMDKATKLQTIFDRIELVETRFELVKNVILKDIACLKNSKEDTTELEQLLTLLQEDLELLKLSNKGQEFMDDDFQQHLVRIRNFSYKSGDKSYFLITDEEKKNLSISRGTLLPKELDKMKEHVTITHEMLSKLTFPQKYSNVVRIASSHHEKLNGKGYPFGHKAENLSLQTRIIAVADIFESLTASDRPYKEGKTLTQSLKIMAYCVRDGEIDIDLMNLFLDSYLFLDYGKKNLPEHQVDNVDIEEIKKIYNN